MNEEELAYSDEEIIKLYQGAKEKKKIIRILADLNDTDVRTIKNFLIRHGLIKDLR